MVEPLGHMSRSELQLHIMRNIEKKIKRLPKRNSIRQWWEHSKNWIRVQEILNANTSMAGRTSSSGQCCFIGADPDGDTFCKEEEN